MHTTHSTCMLQRTKTCGTRIPVLSARHHHYYWRRFISKKKTAFFLKKEEGLTSDQSFSRAILLHQLRLENIQAFVPKGSSSAGEHFSLPPPHEDSCFQQAVGGDWYCHENNHSCYVFCKIEALNSLIISQTCSDTGLNHAHVFYYAEVRWPLRGKVLQRVVALCCEVEILFSESQAFKVPTCQLDIKINHYFT